jgi:hypothetical protein
MCAARRISRYLMATIAAFALLAATAAATTTRVVAGNLVLDIALDFAPKALPRTHDVPIQAIGQARFRTRDGSVPPALTHLRFEFDRHGHVETRGLPTCPARKLAATTAARARKTCRGAIVGTGFATATVAFPEQARISVGTATTFFNAPAIDGDPAMIVHAHLDVPTPTTYLDTFRIERIHRGSFGYRSEADVARIAGGYGSLTSFRFRLGRHWRYKGRTLSFVNARCAAPDHSYLLGRGVTEYVDGTTLSGSLLARCQARKG